MKNKKLLFLSLLATTMMTGTALFSFDANATDPSYENCYGANNCWSCPKSTNCRYAINGDTVTVYGPDTASGLTGDIGAGAFSYYKLPTTVKNLVITGNIESVGNQAFFVSSLETISLGSSVKSVGNQAFDNSPLTSIDLGTSVETIGNNAFFGRTDVTSLTIPDSVTSIGEGAFSGMTGVTGTLTIPDSVTSIGAGAFHSMTGITGELVIPDSVTSIGKGTFYGMTGVTSLTIPDSVTSIGHAAFSGMSGVTSLVVPDSVTTIGSYAFSPMSNLQTLYCPSTVDCGWSQNINPSKVQTYNKGNDGVYYYTKDGVTSYFSSLNNMGSGTTCSYPDQCQEEVAAYQAAKLAKAAAKSAAALQALLDKQAEALLAANTVCHDIETCQAIVNADYNGDIIKIGGKDYASLADLQAGNYIPKRIYSIDEANAVAKPTGNRFSIKYR